MGLTPGVYGDYKAFNSRAFQLTGWGLVDIAVTKTWTLLAGAAVVRQLDMRVMPVGGLVWTPNDATRLELLVPAAVRLGGVHRDVRVAEEVCRDGRVVVEETVGDLQSVHRVLRVHHRRVGGGCDLGRGEARRERGASDLDLHR